MRNRINKTIELIETVLRNDGEVMTEEQVVELRDLRGFWLGAYTMIFGTPTTGKTKSTELREDLKFFWNDLMSHDSDITIETLESNYWALLTVLTKENFGSLFTTEEIVDTWMEWQKELNDSDDPEVLMANMLYQFFDRCIGDLQELNEGDFDACVQRLESNEGTELLALAKVQFGDTFKDAYILRAFTSFQVLLES